MFPPAKLRILPGVWMIFAMLACWGQQREPAGASFSDRTFDFYHEFYGPRAYTNPEAAANFRNRMANGVSLQPPFDAAFIDFVKSRGIHLMVDPAVRDKRDLNAAALAAQQKAIEELARLDGMQRVLWNIMPEWDQSGGSWVPEGRPSYSGLTKAQAHEKFLNYYSSNYPAVKSVFDQPRSSRKHWLASITDHPANTFYAYEMGADICLLERSIDELGDISTGIAFIRGAARQYGRPWGIDISTYRTSNQMATKFDDRETLLGGWSPSYLRRHYYLAYMAGAHVLKNEATGYYRRDAQLDPLGRVNQEFADFALIRHADIGRASVPTALLVDHASGFDPKHWIYNQDDAVWYQDIPYTDGDRMINNFLKLAYPNHWLHGQTPGAPFNDRLGQADARSFQSYLARGGDPRPFEPMSSTRYGHSMDVITDRAPAETLRQYKTIIMLGDVPVSERLREALIAWVDAGGTLVLTVRQQGAFDETFLGVSVGSETRKGASSTWLLDGVSYREATFRYSPLRITSASVLAIAEDSPPLITVNSVGQGRVILSAAHYLETEAMDQLLAIGTRLFDWLSDRTAAATIEGAPVEYLITEDPTRVIVTVVNNSGHEWFGSISLPSRGDVISVREYVSDEEIRWTSTNGRIRVAGQVLPYDLKVYAVEFVQQ